MGSRQCPLCSSPVPDTARSCPTCGSPLDSQAGTGGGNPDLVGLLPPSTRLKNDSFSIGKLLGRGGFGITYFGADLRLKRAVAIKEFFPAGSTRQGKNVVLPGGLSPDDYALATQKFLQEAQVVARFRNPGIVNVYEVFEENQTAYMVMEYLQGETLMDRLERYGKPLPEGELVSITGPVADALGEVHAAGVLHRDIKPQNIMLVGAADPVRPVLIDFGAAREFASGMVNRHSIVLTPGYAPLEQYGEQARRGPFTDVYALAATLYHVATGEQPPAATERALGVALKPPRSLNPALSVSFERAISHGLEMKVDARPQTARDFYREMVGTQPVPTPTPAPEPRRIVPPPTPQPPPPSPAVGHIDRVRQIAREINQGAVVQTDRLTCPVCRSATMRDRASSIRCPVCRSAVLRELVPASDRLRCPSCRRGQLEPATPAAAPQPGVLLRCPACRVGSVTGYVKSQMFLVPDAWARCDTCGADFDYHVQQDTLTLAELPGGPGHLSPEMLGETRTRREWAALASGNADQYACRVCGSQFDTCAPGRLEWVAQGGRPDRVPLAHRGECLTRLDWAKIAHGVRVDDGTSACPNCDAQFDETEPGQLTLLRASQDPYGTLAAHRGRSYPVDTWRSISSGRREPASRGVICPVCTAELEESGYGGGYVLASYDTARDPYGAGARYHNQRLSYEDWQRIAAGKPPASEVQRLVEEAHRELWAALLAGEISTSGAEESYPEPRSSGEKVVVTFLAVQVRSRFGILYEYDSGQIWLTTARLLYEGNRGAVSIPLSRAAGCEVEDVGYAYGLLVVVRRRDRGKEFLFGMDSGPLGLEVDGLALQLRLDELSFAQLFESLRQTA
ncbi:MAG: serine/threonine protein kinase [Chloroflexota bacterium]|nr:serine/threonine protein kinase [Chloroflexota bacterium]